MNDDKKIYLAEIRDELQQRMNYQHPRNAFNMLWSGWAEQLNRHGIRTRAASSQKLKSGWLHHNDAREFCNYCITGWNPIPRILEQRKWNS